MLRVLLAKDLRRAWRNPLPWLINLLVPLAMTALLGLVFGGKSGGDSLGRIRFAVVDEDQSVLSDLLRGAAGHGEGGRHLEPVFMEREAAGREIDGNRISAVLIIPTNFIRNYLTAREPVSLELIKNPAESIHPAVLEELLGAVVTAMNAVGRNFNSELPEWRTAFEGKVDYRRIAALIERSGDKLKVVQKFVDSPLVVYEIEPPVKEINSGHASETDSKRGSGGNIFAYLLIGLSGMFLLFLGQNAMNDLHHEWRGRTFERYQTLHVSALPFIAGKVVFAVAMLLICATVMLGAGGLVFRIHWREPLASVTLVFSYAGFTAAFFAALVALAPDERRAAVLNNLAGMALGLVGGCAFPPEQLPAFLRAHVTPLMPSYWFADTLRNLQSVGAGIAWGWVAVKLVVLSLVLVALAAMLFRRRFHAGGRA